MYISLGDAIAITIALGVSLFLTIITMLCNMVGISTNVQNVVVLITGTIRK